MNYALLSSETYTKKVGTSEEVLLSTQTTSYNVYHDSLYLPASIKTLKGIASTENVLEDRIIYHNYDEKGNPTEVSKADGTSITYLWGYNQSQPIAKIEGATYTAVTNAIATLNTSYNTLEKIQALSDADNDREVDTFTSAGTRTYVGNEGALREALDALREALDEAMVTTFTYDPLIGVTSITDPRGQTAYYEYDNFNRLQYVKDHEGNILSENQYNYKN